MAEPVVLQPEQEEQYRRYVSQAKQEARSGNLEESIQLFQRALEIRFSEKLTANIKKLEEALAFFALNQENDDFVDVCHSGLMLYGEMHDNLFDHQREGVAFLYKLYKDRKKGGILADDMGLGKTIQVIAFLSGMFDSELIHSVLLIVPTTLVNNWVKEFAKWTPGLRVKVFHGTSKADRNRSLEQIQRRNGILLTTYQMLLNNWQQLTCFAGKEFVWDYIILDEAHKIKTPAAKTTKCVHAIPSKNRILLTGTPVQNNLKELWALFDFACQGTLLGTMKTFRMEYENPITRARAKDATPGEKALGLKISENLMSIIKPHFLRRTKDELQKNSKSELPSHLFRDQSKDNAPTMPSLPRKNDFIVWVFLSPIQEEIYRNFLSLDHIKELLMSVRSPLAELNILKKLCDHPRLLSHWACSQLGLEPSSYREEDNGENEVNELPGMNRNIALISDKKLLQESGKLTFLVALLERLQEEGHRTLVFSQSRKMLDIIEHILTQKHFKFIRIDGTVTHLVEREKRIDMFQKNRDYSVLLLTTQVGGIGLTLTAANRVVIFDPSWNPATDAQAVDRAYRIGQKNNVIIYRLITCGTVEEKIYRRQVFKDSLIRQSTGDKKNPYRYFTMQELRELFILEDTQNSVTQLQLQSLHATQRKTDMQLDEHIAYLHSLEIFGISDHDLMFTHVTVHENEAEDEEAHRYIEHRVQKAQELVQLESQLNNQMVGNMRNMTEGSWLKDTEPSNLPKKKSLKSSSPDSLILSATEGAGLKVMQSSTPSERSLTSSSYVLPELTYPISSDEVVDLVTDDDVSNMANLSSKMTSLIIKDVAGEQMLQNMLNRDVLPSEQKEHLSPRSCEIQVHSFSHKENYSPELKIIFELPVKDTYDEQMHNPNMETLLSKDKEYNSDKLQNYKQNENLNSSFPQTCSLSTEENSKIICCDLSERSQTSSCYVSPELTYPISSDEVVDLVTDDDVSDMANLSSKMTSLIIKDVAGEQMLQNMLNRDVLPSEQKEHLSPRSCEIQVHSFSHKENYSPELKIIFELPVKDTDDEQMHIPNMETLLSNDKEYNPDKLQNCKQNENLNSSFPQTCSLSTEENSKIICCDLSPEASSRLKDVQMKSLQQPLVYVSDDDMQQADCVLPSSHGKVCKMDELKSSPVPFQAASRKIQESSDLWSSGTKIKSNQGNESLVGTSYHQVDFNLVLDSEDSVDRSENMSRKDTSLEETENEGFQLRLDSYCSSVAESTGGEDGGNRYLQSNKGVKESMIMDNCNSPHDPLMDSRESLGQCKKKPMRIIVSDEEEDKFINYLDHKVRSSLTKKDGICMSTPKTNDPENCFSPTVKMRGRRSTASRQSLLHMLLEEVRNATEKEESDSNISYDRSIQNKLERELTSNSRDSMELEEEPSGETLDSGNQSTESTDSSEKEA